MSTAFGGMGEAITLGRRLVAICRWHADSIDVKVVPDHQGFLTAGATNVAFGARVPGARGWWLEGVEDIDGRRVARFTTRRVR